VKLHREELTIAVPGRGLLEITAEIERVVAASGVGTGLCHLFLRHTSASLLVQENADPSARRDLERWFERLAPDGDDFWSHRAEGPDDMPAHVRTALTATSLTVPVGDRKPMLGTWQGVYLFEHRLRPHRRRIVATVYGR
jgi:secondary thiamine-phosphate synthase enzyme